MKKVENLIIYTKKITSKIFKLFSKQKLKKNYQKIINEKFNKNNSNPNSHTTILKLNRFGTDLFCLSSEMIWSLVCLWEEKASYRVNFI